ncbi:MAG: histidine kinase dimerization/phospho-acceptor domain-containing protein [Coxiellaceae bacterium]|nr:histidine kinase dimerization/phospho-acceptor domain-containing protein [Coxiellaceae bacterium]
MLWKRAEGTEKQIFLFGIVLFFNYPIFYLIWKYAAIQSYESLTLRIFASFICIPLICVRQWPKKLSKFIPIYWYCAVTFCLPFFFTYMTIMNHGAVVWLLNLILALLLIFILLDFTGLCLTVVLGAGFAFLAFSYISPKGLAFDPGSINLAGTLGTFFAALVVGGVFARNREVMVAEKIRKQSEAANNVKTEFIANMSHDIRTPITGIIGLVQDLLNKADSTNDYLVGDTKSSSAHSNSNEILLDIVNLIQTDGRLLLSATDELLQLCNEILETINLESGVINEEAVSFSIRDLIQQNIELFSPVATNKKLELTSKIDGDVPIYLSGLY